MVVQNLAALSSNVGSKLPNLESVTITVQRVHTALTERKLLNQTATFGKEPNGRQEFGGLSQYNVGPKTAYFW